jgi:hypothetical protein
LMCPVTVIVGLREGKDGAKRKGAGREASDQVRSHRYLQS